jgi:hypothetical protein
VRRESLEVIRADERFDFGNFGKPKCFVWNVVLVVGIPQAIVIVNQLIVESGAKSGGAGIAGGACSTPKRELREESGFGRLELWGAV